MFIENQEWDRNNCTPNLDGCPDIIPESDKVNAFKTVE
jgi:hypothetical protein